MSSKLTEKVSQGADPSQFGRLSKLPLTSLLEHAGEDLASLMDVRAPQKADEKGLDKAYSNPQNIHYDPENRTMYIAGSHTAQDWTDDFTLIPWGGTKYSEREQAADQFYVRNHDKIDRVVGHSLGGAIALDLEEKYNVPSVTYGAPVDDPFDRPHHTGRYAHPGDPVASLDSGAQRIGFEFNPHSYHGYT